MPFGGEHRIDDSLFLDTTGYQYFTHKSLTTLFVVVFSLAECGDTGDREENAKADPFQKQHAATHIDLHKICSWTKARDLQLLGLKETSEARAVAC